MGEIVDINVQAVLSVIDALEVVDKKRMLKEVLYCFKLEREINNTINIEEDYQ